MLLAIDAGNTNIVFALVEGGKIKARWRIATDARRTADEYAVWLHQLLELEGYGRDAVDAVIIATVVPRALHNLEVLRGQIFPRRAADRGAGGRGLADRARRRRTSERRRRPSAQRHRRPRQILAISSSSISGRRRPSTSSARPAHTRAGSSRPGSTFRSTRWSAPPPSCHASRSRRRPIIVA